MARIKKEKKPLGRHFIKEWREHRGLTQAQLADRVNLDRGQLSKIENRKQPYSQPLLEEIAYALQCEPGDLVMRDPTSQTWSIHDNLLKGVREEDLPRVIELISVFKKAV